jgi:hypothetical protein
LPASASGPALLPEQEKVELPTIAVKRMIAVRTNS